jgi:alginate O-acetyltransferase complex protein AlgI
MFETPLFWSLLFIAAACLYIIPNERVRIRAGVLVAVSVLCLGYVVKLNPWWILFLSATSLWIPVGLRWTRGLATTRPYTASLLVFSPVLVPWVAGKQAVAVGFAPLGILYFVGFSFYLIKAWTLVKDYHDGRIERVDSLVVAAYFLFFPTYIAGPMHFYGEFAETIERPARLDGEAVVDAVFRILLGMVKIKLVAGLFLPLSLEAVKASGHAGWKGLTIGSFAYSIVIWADFSGYSDLAIATSRLAGIRTPENFNYPYAATSIRDFWRRWHMTFSRVLMSYVFVPVSRRLRSASATGKILVLIVAPLLTFLFCGYWHGPTLNFLLWGLYHGAGIVAYELYTRRAARPRAQREERSRLIESMGRAGAALLTFSFVSFGWIFFVLPTAMILQTFARLAKSLS